jgi:hypothetical protein
VNDKVIDPADEERRELERRRAETARAEEAARKADRPKLVAGIVAGWIGVAIAFFGAQLTSTTTGQRVVWVGLWVLVQGVAIVVLWALRANAREVSARHHYW